MKKKETNMHFCTATLAYYHINKLSHYLIFFVLLLVTTVGCFCCFESILCGRCT